MYSFEQVSSEIAQRTTGAWLSQLSDRDLQDQISVAPSTFLGKLALAHRYANGERDQDTHIYGLIREAEPCIACALLDVTYAHPSRDRAWLKVLSIQVEPKLDVSSGASIPELALIAATALVKVLGLTFQEHPCQKLKVYGTTPLTLDFIEGVAASSVQLEGITITKHGNWLVIER